MDLGRALKREKEARNLSGKPDGEWAAERVRTKSERITWNKRTQADRVGGKCARGKPARPNKKNYQLD